MDTCRSHVKGVDYAIYSADCVQFTPVIAQVLQDAITPIGSSINIVAPHGTAFDSCVLTYFYRLGINAEIISGAINGISHFLANFLGKPCRQLTAAIELPSANQVWQIIFALIVQTMKQEILAVKVKSLSLDTECYNLNVRELWNDATARYISELINTIPGESLAYPEDSNEIRYEVAHKQCISS